MQLKQSSKIGLFTKGRASSPYRRRGRKLLTSQSVINQRSMSIVPDLSFSELKFHNHHRQQHQLDEPSNRFRSSSHSKKQKSLEQNEEFSKFFASKKSPLRAISHNKLRLNLRHRTSNDPCPHELSQARSDPDPSSTPQTCLPPIELPGRPFLGFGQKAPETDSPLKHPGARRMSSSPVKGTNTAVVLPLHSQISWTQSHVTPRTQLRKLEISQTKTSASSRNKVEPCQAARGRGHISDEQDPGDFNNEESTPSELIRNNGELNERESRPVISPAEKLMSLQGKVLVENYQSRERAPIVQPAVLDGNVAESKTAKNSNGQRTHLDVLYTQQGFMNELGELLKKWNQKETLVDEMPKARAEKAVESTPPSQRSQDGPHDGTHDPSEQKIDNKHDREQQRKIASCSNGDMLGSGCQNVGDNSFDSEANARYCLNREMADKAASSIQRPSRHDTSAPKKHEQSLFHLNRQPLMPFTQPNVRPGGPSLFMSPESIYTMQMHEQQPRCPSTYRQNESFSHYWPSLGQRPTSRATFRPHSHLSRPSRPFSARHGTGSANTCSIANEPHLFPQNIYQTPSLSNFSSAVERANLYSDSTPGEQSRFFACLEDRCHDISYDVQSFQPDSRPPSRYVPGTAVYRNSNLQPSKLPPPFESHDLTSRPQTTSVTTPHFLDLENRSIERAFAEAAPDNEQHTDALVLPSEENFPTRFWMPNRLY